MTIRMTRMACMCVLLYDAHSTGIAPMLSIPVNYRRVTSARKGAEVSLPGDQPERRGPLGHIGTQTEGLLRAPEPRVGRHQRVGHVALGLVIVGSPRTGEGGLEVDKALRVSGHRRRRTQHPQRPMVLDPELVGQRQRGHGPDGCVQRRSFSWKQPAMG